MCVLQAQKVSDDLLQKIGSKNRRALDLVAAKCYYYHARVYEFLNQFDTIRRYACARARMHLRTHTHAHPIQVLMNPPDHSSCQVFRCLSCSDC